MQWNFIAAYIYVSLMTNYIGYLVCSFVLFWQSVQILCPFLSRSFTFLLLHSGGSSYILDTSPFLPVCSLPFNSLNVFWDIFNFNKIYLFWVYITTHLASFFQMWYKYTSRLVWLLCFFVYGYQIPAPCHISFPHWILCTFVNNQFTVYVVWVFSWTLFSHWST